MFSNSWRHKSPNSCFSIVRNRGFSSSPYTQSSSIRALQNAFKDPSSPYYLAPGTQGPSEEFMMNLAPSPEVQKPAGEASTPSNAEAAESWALDHGYDPLSFWEQKVVWGDLDSFRHLNNVRYVRFIESGRMKYFAELAKLLDEAKAKDMMEGKGKSIILKSISVNFKRPVTYPDTLLIAHKPHSLQPTRFHLATSIYSYAQQTEVANSDSIGVWYDYDSLKKCEAPPELGAILRGRTSETTP